MTVEQYLIGISYGFVASLAFGLAGRQLGRILTKNPDKVQENGGKSAVFASGAAGFSGALGHALLYPTFNAFPYTTGFALGSVAGALATLAINEYMRK